MKAFKNVKNRIFELNSMSAIEQCVYVGGVRGVQLRNAFTRRRAALMFPYEMALTKSFVFWLLGKAKPQKTTCF